MPRQLIESCSTFLTNIEEFLSNDQVQVSSENILALQDIKTNLLKLNLTQKKEDHEITFNEIKQIQAFVQQFSCDPLKAFAQAVGQTCEQTLIHRSILSKSLLDLFTSLQMIDPNYFKLDISQE